MRQAWGMKRLPGEPARPSAMLFHPLIYPGWQVDPSSTLLFPKNERSVGNNKGIKAGVQKVKNGAPEMS